MYVYKIRRAINIESHPRKNVLGSFITYKVLSCSVLEYCIALETW